MVNRIIKLPPYWKNYSDQMYNLQLSERLGSLDIMGPAQLKTPLKTLEHLSSMVSRVLRGPPL